MEKVRKSIEQESSADIKLGGRVLHLTTVIPEDLTESSKNFTDILVEKEQLMEDFVFGDKLADNDTLMIDGRDAIEMLPRPEIGNSRLVLMEVLDQLPPGFMLPLRIDDNKAESVAAD